MAFNLKYLINYIRTMKCYLYFLVLQLVAIVFLITYVFLDFGQNHEDGVVFVAEISFTAIVFLEILLRLLSNKKAFFKNSWNIVDLIGIIVIAVLFYVLNVYEEEEGKVQQKGDNIIPATLLGTRYFVQMIRILLTIKQNRQMMTTSGMKFQFEDEEPTDFGDDIRSQRYSIMVDH